VSSRGEGRASQPGGESSTSSNGHRSTHFSDGETGDDDDDDDDDVDDGDDRCSVTSSSDNCSEDEWDSRRRLRRSPGNDAPAPYTVGGGFVLAVSKFGYPAHLYLTRGWL